MRRLQVIVQRTALCGCVSILLASFLLSLGSTKIFAQATDANGLITSSQWLIVGPFQTTFACSGSADDFYRNHIGPVHHIACEAPAEGDEIDGYNPGDPSVGSSGYVGPASGAGKPYWRAFDDGSDDGDQNLDADVNGDQTQVMSWLATYVEYTGAKATFVELCVGSDDGVQVWVDKTLVHNNNSACRPRGLCDDTVPVLITPGVHVLKIGCWENAGGWGVSLGFRQGGVPVDDTNPDWLFLGRDGSAKLGACDPGDFTTFVPPVQGLTCVRNANGSRALSWSNPPAANPATPIEIDVDGVKIATVPGTATSYTVAAANVPAGKPFICVINSSNIPRCTNCSLTDDNGLIHTSAWLALGPFATNLACTNNNLILGNHIAPSEIRKQYPAAGDSAPYDAALAVSDGYHPAAPTDGTGNPVWRPFDDGSDDGDQDLESDVAGGLDHQMTWLLTYVEYLGANPVDVTLCIGSDDGVQVWDNCELAHNNNNCRGRAVCQDNVTRTITKGVHAIKMGIWERDGGWGGSLGLIDAASSQPITDDPDTWPDWHFWGRTRPPGFVPPTCPGCPPDPVQITSCEFGKVALGTGVVVTWINPPTIDPAVPINVLVNGVQALSVPPTATQAGIPKTKLPPRPVIYTIEVVACGGVGATCSPDNTDPAGYINSTRWMVVGPFSDPFGCNGSSDSILGNHIAPSFIGCEYPSSADGPESDANEVDYDPADPQVVSTGYVGPANANNLPFWRPFNDGSDDGDQNLDGDVNGDQNSVMSWMATYIEIVGAPLDVELCVGSDDGVQVWDNSTLVHNNNACRPRGLCDDRVRVTLEEGQHRMAVGVWENGGGWGLSLGLVDATTGEPIIDDGSRDDVIFHGSARPEAVTDYPCKPPEDPITNFACVRNGAGGVDVTWTNPANQESSIDITLNGVPSGTVPATASKFTVPAPLPQGLVNICVDNGSFRPTCCSFLNGNELYINCGGPEFTDTSGRVWTEDTLGNPSPFLTGPNANTADFGNPAGVNLTADSVVDGGQFPAEIFPQERWNDGPIEYTISGLPTGDYEVTLLFMEGCCSDGCEDIPDPALSAGSCRVFDININGVLVEDQFSQNVAASQIAATAPGAASNYVAVARVYQVAGVSSIQIAIDDLGPGEPPQNASIKGIGIRPSGPPVGKLFHRGDSDDNGQIQLTDAVRILNVLFLGTGVIPLPGPPPSNCGSDPTPDSAGDLGCVSYTRC